MRFRSRIDDGVKITPGLPAGKKVEAVYGYKLNEQTGRKEVAKVGISNVYLKKQEAKEDTLIYNVIDRYNRGDLSAIGEVQPGFVDIVGMPSSLAEAQQVMIDVENQFNSLPLEERRKYGQSVSEYLQALDKQFRENLNKSKDEVVPEVIENGNNEK